MPARLVVYELIVSLLVCSAGMQSVTGQDAKMIKWTLNLQVDPADLSVVLPISLEMITNEPTGPSTAWIVNGPERIESGVLIPTRSGGVIGFPHFDSQLQFDPGWSPNSPHLNKTTKGIFRKRRGADNFAEVPFIAQVTKNPDWEDPTPFCGRWSVQFEGDEDPSVGVFEKDPTTNGVNGTFLTTTGDYRYLSGGVVNGQLTLSCFDGAHAFLFHANLNENDRLTGTFRSGNWHKATWTGVREDNAQLPDAFQQTVATDRIALGELKFPNVDGEVMALDDPRLQGRCRIIEIFGSWCPNCQDAGEYLTELHERYSARGLAITGLAFEMTGDHAQDAEQVRTFVARNKTPYPILIAGTSDKGVASESLPIIDRVRSYPTMLFLDSSGKIIAIYTGFSGPATGEAHAELRKRFEKIIESCLDE